VDSQNVLYSDALYGNYTGIVAPGGTENLAR
jgi:hypothetical protein